MEINGTGERVRVICSLAELKELYRALFKAMDIRSGDVDNSDMLMDVQTYLYGEAMKQGVNLEDHTEWERFLGKAESDIRPCEVRYANYPFGVDQG
ncbi:MAG TPA: hypothetical protein VGM37_09265 [Armatimonadota bacterium]